VKESPHKAGLFVLEGSDVISSWCGLIYPLKNREDGKRYTLGEGLVDCSLLGFGDLLGHLGSLFGLVGLVWFYYTLVVVAE
jgi:hypothetical protein